MAEEGKSADDFLARAREVVMKTLDAQPMLLDRLGVDSAKEVTLKEVGDGNINYVWILTGSATEEPLVLKQAPPFVRIVPTSPLPPSRIWFEHAALLKTHACVRGRVPEVYHFDKEAHLFVMECLQPHVIARTGLRDGVRYPLLAEHMSDFLAKTLFHCSALGLGGDGWRSLVGKFAGNSAMCSITEQVIFTDPFLPSGAVFPNRWTTPALDDAVAALQSDIAVKAAAMEMKARFMCNSEALLHGDLHAGSLMVTADDTRVIDAEFAFAGPRGFDIGCFLAALLIAFFAQAGHASAEDDRRAYSAWLLTTAKDVWMRFLATFSRLFKEERAADLWPTSVLDGEAGAAAADSALQAMLKEMEADSLGFAACEMIRRTVGIAHASEMESVAEDDKRAQCEKALLACARRMLVERKSLSIVAMLDDMLAAVGSC